MSHFRKLKQLTAAIILALAYPAAAEESVDFMAIGDSAWIESKGEYKDKNSADIHPGLEGIYNLKAKDINFLNLEASVTTNCKKFIAKPYTFAVGSETILGFASWGFNLFALANNHTIDCLRPNVKNTVDAGFKLSKKYIKNIGYHGVASSERALLKPAIIKIRNMKIGMISIKAWNDKKRPYLGNNLNHEKLFDSLKNEKVDFRILSIHGGIERTRIADPEIVKLSRKFISEFNGDLVLGHHPHVVSGMELFKKKNGRFAYVIHSLGNGLHNGINGLNGDGLVLKLNLNKSRGVEDIRIHPLRSNAFRLRPIPEKRASYFATQMFASSMLVTPFEQKDYSSIEKVHFTFADLQIPTPGYKVITTDNKKTANLK